jgi:hypothetical protein
MDWQYNGVKIIPAGDLDSNTPQTPGLSRALAITYLRTGAKLRAGTVVVQPVQPKSPFITTASSKTSGTHRSREGRMRWGDAPTHDRIGVAR